MERKIDACEMWIWKRMLRVAWTKRRTNESIVQEIGEMRGRLSLFQRATRQKMMFLGHVMKAAGLKKETMLAWEGGRRSGRPNKKWMEEILVRTGIDLEELREAARNRSACRLLTIRRIDGTRCVVA